MDRLSASKIVALRVAKARAKRFVGSKKGEDDSQLDLFEAEGGRRYSRQYVRSVEGELRAKKRGGGLKVMGKARFSSRSEAGRYAANMRWQGEGEQGSGDSKTVGVGGIKVPSITGIKDGSIGSIEEGSYETDQFKIENYLDELKSAGEKLLGVDGFKEKFGRTVTRIKDDLEDGSRIRSGSPSNELAGAKKIHQELAQLEAQIEADRPLARDKANAEKIVKGFKSRLKRLSDERTGQVPQERMREAVDLENRAEGGRQILAATKSDGKEIIRQLEIMEAQTEKTAKYYKKRAENNLADKPRFSQLARNEFGRAESYSSKLGGAVEVFEALYDTQLER